MRLLFVGPWPCLLKLEHIVVNEGEKGRDLCDKAIAGFWDKCIYQLVSHAGQYTCVGFQ